MMVLEFYKLEEQPFGVTPDYRYLFLTKSHQDALASLTYGIESGCGFVSLIATPGMGKTTLLLEALHILRDRARIVFLFQTISTPLDLLQSLLSGLGVHEITGSMLEMQIRLREILIEQYHSGKPVVMVIDEAQNLDDGVLELVRMLSNFETTRDKLIQIILAGQPQLAENIGSSQLLQLRQRISIFARLKPFTPEETSLYIVHRLRIAGYHSDMPLFTKDALALIALCGEGIPRNINNLCFNALSLGCAVQQKPIDRDILRQVIADLDLGPWRNKRVAFAQAKERTAEEVPALAAVAERPSILAGCSRKVALAAVVLVALSGALFTRQGWLSRAAAPQSPPTSVPKSDPLVSLPGTPASTSLPDTSAPNQALADAISTPPSYRPTPWIAQPVDTTSTVRVAPGQTLMKICIEKFGDCTAELLQQIHELNPSLNNPDHIESGQDLRLPALAAQPRAGEQPLKSSAVEAASQ